MASETITRTDLTNILNEVLPPTPSEYKKLLWTNPSPTETFSPQTVSLDLSNYDAVYIISKKTASESPYFVTESIIGVTSQTFFIEGGVSYDRQIIVNQTGIEFAVACFLLPSATVITIDNNRCVPYQIYGIKYDRVAPPQVEMADCVIEQGTSGIWTYRKWNSGIAECWGTMALTGINYIENSGAAGGYRYSSGEYNLPLTFIDTPSGTATHCGSGSNYWGAISNVGLSKTTIAFAIDRGNAASNVNISVTLEVKGRWK